jgi:hypothetical protein
VREGHLHQRPRSARAADCVQGPASRKSCRYAIGQCSGAPGT